MDYSTPLADLQPNFPQNSHNLQLVHFRLALSGANAIIEKISGRSVPHDPVSEQQPLH
jgi:hypothetical protein